MAQQRAIQEQQTAMEQQFSWMTEADRVLRFLAQMDQVTRIRDWTLILISFALS
jgi:hypothetical protein